MTVLRSTVSSVLHGAVDLLFPDVCTGCDSAVTDTTGLCGACEVKLLSLIALPACPRCGSTLGPHVPAREDGCGNCPHPLPRFARVHRLGPYAPPLRRIVQDIKYRRSVALLRRLSALLAERLRTQEYADARTPDAAAGVLDPDAPLPPPFDVVLSVPMHWRRRLVRGFDHAALLADALARELRLPLGDDLVRTRPTPPQVHLPRTRRLENVRNAFALRRRSDLTGARVLLVDDVTTTGATAGECARTLLNGRAARVTLAVLAKAESPVAYTEGWR